MIRVTDINDNPPYFQTTLYEGEISEGAAIGEHVISYGRDLIVNALDEDLNPKVLHYV